MSEIHYVVIEIPGESISRTAWDKLIAADSELEPIGSIPGRNPMTGDMVDVFAPHSAKWIGHPDGVAFYFQFDDGRILVGSTDQHGIDKARAIARILGARVDASVD